MSEFRYPLGAKAKDKLTGFEGIIISRCDHITGCNTYGLKGRVDKDGKPQDAEWFDEGMIKIIGQGIKPNSVRSVDDGGPLADNPVV